VQSIDQAYSHLNKKNEHLRTIDPCQYHVHYLIMYKASLGCYVPSKFGFIFITIINIIKHPHLSSLHSLFFGPPWKIEIAWLFSAKANRTIAVVAEIASKSEIS
jgi:hypothetical protein